MRRVWASVFAPVLILVPVAWAQSSGRSANHESAISVEPQESDLLPIGEDPHNHLVWPFTKHLAEDQRNFWRAPFQLRRGDLKWMVPFAGATAAALASDSWISRQVPASHVASSKTISNVAVASLVSLSAGSFLLGHLKNSDQLIETGLLTGEAAIDSTMTSYLLKTAFARQRPYQDAGRGTFFAGGSSFPSEHAALAWSIASVWAHEYPGTLSQTLAYGLASAVTLTRVTGQEHFASDAIIGSALGWYFGRQVYRARHDRDLAGSAWGNVFDHEAVREGGVNQNNLGSSYVPIDSWVYPAFDRLIAQGLISDAYLGMRPWTRLQCAGFVEEAQEHVQDFDSMMDHKSNDGKLISALAAEFKEETRRLDGSANVGAELESVYFRGTSISGEPLRDGFHFGQTIIDDYGRPYCQGFNAIAGVAAHAEAGRLAIFIQGEMQHAPAAASESASVLAATAAVDGTLTLPNATAELNQFRLINATIGFTQSGVQFSFGRQSLWLGPGNSGPLLFSDNAAPLTMLRIDSVAPFQVPILSRLLGPARSEFFLGQLSGQNWEYTPQLFGPNLYSQPFLHGSKLSFHPTSSLEIGVGFTAQFGGPGNPFTWANFVRTFYSHRVATGTNPGKRLSEFNFSYRLPGNWMEIYSDAMVIDEYSPIGSTRPAINPGIYFPRLPMLNRVDLRLEGITTDLNVPGHFGPGAFYWDGRYRSGYTNDGNLIGSWIGRRGRAEQGWLTYHLGTRDSVQFGLRRTSVDKTFLQGGEIRDLNIAANLKLADGLGFGALLQQENWRFPLLSPTAKSDVTASVQLTFWPKHN